MAISIFFLTFAPQKTIKNMRQDYLKIARALYKPTEKVERLVLKLCDLFDEPMPNGVTITSIEFKEGALKVGNLSVRELVRGGQHCGVEVHWYRDHKLTTKSDPFCSAFILKYNSLQKLYREVDKQLSLIKANCK